MIWHKNAVRPTAFEQVRINAMLKGGCIMTIVRRERGLEVPTRGKVDVHHLIEGNKRFGHWYTIPLHSWWNGGVVPYPCKSTEEARARYGATLKDSLRAFRECHGFDDRDLWVHVQGLLGMSVQFPPSKIYKAPQTEAEVSR